MLNRRCAVKDIFYTGLSQATTEEKERILIPSLKPGAIHQPAKARRWLLDTQKEWHVWGKTTNFFTESIQTVSWVRNKQQGVQVRDWTYRVPKKTSKGRLMVQSNILLKEKKRERKGQSAMGVSLQWCWKNYLIETSWGEFFSICDFLPGRRSWCTSQSSTLAGKGAHPWIKEKGGFSEVTAV